MRFHVVSLPHTQTTEAFASCAFTEKVRKFCVMMHDIMGHDVFLYSGEFNDAPCTEHVCCLTEDERARAVGNRHFSQASFNYHEEHWIKFNQRAADAIRARAQPRDFICVIGGLAHKQVTDSNPGIMAVEFGIGYAGTYATHRIWESYAWMHMAYGAEAVRKGGNINNATGHWFDAVIPGYFEVEKFPFKLDLPAPEKPYYLYVGRMTALKGIRVAEEACRRKSARLVIAGPANDWIPGYGEYVGEVTPAQRGPLMAQATALFVPTEYVEPFGNVAVESQASGTPVICTDWGAMTETVEHGKTGFRCRTLEEFVDAMDHVRSLDPVYIRNRAIATYSLRPIAEMYDYHFKRLSKLWSDGWYSVNNVGEAA